MIKKVSVYLVFQLMTTVLFGQIKFFADLSGTYSIIPEQSVNGEIITGGGIFGGSIITEVTKSYQTKPGLDITFGFEKKLHNKISISSGIGLSYYRYTRNFDVAILNQPDPVVNERGTLPAFGESLGGFVPGDFRHNPDDSFRDTPNVGKTKMGYFNIPVNFHYSIISDKLNISVGAVNSFLAFSSQVESFTQFHQNTGLTRKEVKVKSGADFSSYLLSAEITLQYRLLKKVWVMTGYNHGLTSIYDDKSSATGGEKFRTAKLGLRYVLN